MYLVFISNLNKNEIIVLKEMLDSAKLYCYSIINVAKDKLPTKEIFDASISLLVYDDTKSKSVFIKRLENFYGKDFQNRNTVFRITKPNTFNTSDESIQETWDVLVKMHNLLLSRDMNVELLEGKLPDDLIDMLHKNSPQKVFILKKNNAELHIIPDGAHTNTDNFITYTELSVLLSAKLLFNFNKMSIINTK